MNIESVKTTWLFCFCCKFVSFKFQSREGEEQKRGWVDEEEIGVKNGTRNQILIRMESFLTKLVSLISPSDEMNIKPRLSLFCLWQASSFRQGTSVWLITRNIIKYSNQSNISCGGLEN